MQEKPSKQRAALFGGLIIGVISGVPGLGLINCCCCAGIMAGGILAVYLYKQEFVEGMPPLESSDALVLGIIAGIVGALSGAVISGLITVMFGPVEAEMMKRIWEKSAAYLEQQGSVPAGSFDQLREQLDKSIEESRSIGGILRGLILTLILYPIFSMLGGLIGYALFGRKQQPQVPAAPSHP